MTTIIEVIDAPLQIQVVDGNQFVVEVGGDQIIVNAGGTGLQGPPGPSGATGVETVLTAEAVGGGRVITAAGLYTQAGTYNLTFGITVAAAVSGATVEVKSGGVMVEASWAWTPGVAIFASPNGIMTQTTPASGLQRQVARAVTATKIIIDLQPSIALG